jgi:hypothetical protein
MDSLRYHLLENPFYVMVVLGLAELGLLSLWWSWRTRRLAWALAAPAVLAGMIYLLAAWVKTDREQILELSEQIAADIRADRLDAARLALDEAYQGWAGDKQQTLQMGRGLLEHFRIRAVQIIWTTLAVESGRARMRAQTIISYQLDQAGEGRSALQWDLTWIKRPVGWRILDVQEPVQALDLGPPAG